MHITKVQISFYLEGNKEETPMANVIFTFDDGTMREIDTPITAAILEFVFEQKEEPICA